MTEINVIVLSRVFSMTDEYVKKKKRKSTE